jgi:hypothetical protein
MTCKVVLNDISKSESCFAENLHFAARLIQPVMLQLIIVVCSENS